MDILIGLKSFTQSSFQMTVNSYDVIAIIATLNKWL